MLGYLRGHTERSRELRRLLIDRHLLRMSKPTSLRGGVMPVLALALEQGSEQGPLPRGTGMHALSSAIPASLVLSVLTCACGIYVDRECGDAACFYNEFCCDGRCVDLRSDVDNCGNCGRRCRTENHEICAEGRCVIMEPCDCGAFGLRQCDGECADFSFHPRHCGGCTTATEDHSCPPDHACYWGECRRLMN